MWKDRSCATGTAEVMKRTTRIGAQKISYSSRVDTLSTKVVIIPDAFTEYNQGFSFNTSLQAVQTIRIKWPQVSQRINKQI